MIKLIAVTVDYETWHPIPPGKEINWEADVFQPAQQMMDLADLLKIPLTFFVEMGEYFWLKKNNPPLAGKMTSQWKEMMRRGHDLQLHLHPNWLPELGARFENDTWFWDWSKAKAGDYPGDLTALIRQCKEELEKILKPVKSDYQVSCYRAGAYQAQPFQRLQEALLANGLFCDSSVYAGGVSAERGYDYSLAYSNHQPYFADAADPQLQSSDLISRLVEIPVFTYDENRRWFLDGDEAEGLSDKLFRFGKSENEKMFLGKWELFWKKLGKKKQPRVLLPRDYYVMIGHTKGQHFFSKIAEEFKKIAADERCEFVSLSRMARLAQEDLESSRQWPGKQGISEALRTMDWVHRVLNPEKPSEGTDPVAILEKGYAYCIGYTIVLGKLLKRKGYSAKWLTMMAHNHPRGRGQNQEDSHEVLLVTLEGKEMILDPMANTCIPHSLAEVLQNPALAIVKKNPDERYSQRGYQMYDTDFWYSRVVKYAVRSERELEKEIKKWTQVKEAS